MDRSIDFVEIEHSLSYSIQKNEIIFFWVICSLGKNYY